MKGIVMQYKGYYGFARYYAEDGYYHGSLENIQAHATFGGETAEEVMEDFRDTIEDYLQMHDEAETNDQHKLVIDMSDYPMDSDKPASLMLAEG